MRYFWIFLIAFALAFLAQGDSNSLSSENHKEEVTLPLTPSESDMTEGDFIEQSSVIKRRRPTDAPQGAAERIPFVSGKIKKLLKNIGAGKHISNKVGRLLKSRLETEAEKMGKADWPKENLRKESFSGLTKRSIDSHMSDGDFVKQNSTVKQRKPPNVPHEAAERIRFASSKIKNLLQAIGAGKHISKKVGRLLKSKLKTESQKMGKADSQKESRGKEISSKMRNLLHSIGAGKLISQKVGRLLKSKLETESEKVGKNKWQKESRRKDSFSELTKRSVDSQRSDGDFVEQNSTVKQRKPTNASHEAAERIRFSSSKIKNLLQAIGAGKHISKKVGRLLKSKLEIESEKKGKTLHSQKESRGKEILSEMAKKSVGSQRSDATEGDFVEQNPTVKKMKSTNAPEEAAERIWFASSKIKNLLQNIGAGKHIFKKVGRLLESKLKTESEKMEKIDSQRESQGKEISSKMKNLLQNIRARKRLSKKVGRLLKSKLETEIEKWESERRGKEKEKARKRVFSGLTKSGSESQKKTRLETATVFIGDQDVYHADEITTAVNNAASQLSKKKVFEAEVPTGNNPEAGEWGSGESSEEATEELPSTDSSLSDFDNLLNQKMERAAGEEENVEPSGLNENSQMDTKVNSFERLSKRLSSYKPHPTSEVTAVEEFSTEEEDDEERPHKRRKSGIDEESGKYSGSGDTSNKQRPPIDESKSMPDREDVEDENDETEGASSRQRRAAPEYRSSFHDSSKRNTQTKHNKAFSMPASDVRWKGFDMSHVRSHDDGVTDKKKEIQQSLTDAITTLSTAFTLGGTVLVILMGLIFLLAIWPIRKYFEYLLSRTASEDVETGGSGGELSSIRVDRSVPSESLTGRSSVSNPQFPKNEQTATPIPQPPGSARESYGQPRYSEVGRTSQSKGTPNQSSRKSRDEIIAEDKKRDSRNAERRKIIKKQTTEKRNSLADNLMIAKTFIDEHAKNKEYEEKASERRQKIKQHSSFPGTPSAQNKRRKSFAEEIQSACSVITPRWNDIEKKEESKEKCRQIKNQIADKRKPSLLDEIEVARQVILDSELDLGQATEDTPLGNNQTNPGDSTSAKVELSQKELEDLELTRLWGVSGRSKTNELRNNVRLKFKEGHALNFL